MKRRTIKNDTCSLQLVRTSLEKSKWNYIIYRFENSDYPSILQGIAGDLLLKFPEKARVFVAMQNP